MRQVDSGQNTDRTDCRSWEEGKSPAKRSIMGDAGGILRGSSGKTNAVAFSVVPPHRLELFKAASNVFVAEERALGGVRPTEMSQTFKTASTRIGGRRPGLLGRTGRLTPATPPPAGSFPRS